MILLSDKGIDGSTPLESIVEQNHLDLLMLDGVQSVINTLWVGPYRKEPLFPSLSRNSALLYSMVNHGTRIDKERIIRTSKDEKYSHSARIPNGALNF